MHTLLANLIAAARRFASDTAAALDVRVERIGSAMTGGADFAAMFNLHGHYSMLNAQRGNTRSINHNPIPSYPLQRSTIADEWRKGGKHPGATPQVAGGYT